MGFIRAVIMMGGETGRPWNAAGLWRCSFRGRNGNSKWELEDCGRRSRCLPSMCFLGTGIGGTVA